MTVAKRTSAEHDIVALPGHKLIRHDDFIFPWYAEHKVNGVCNFSAVFMTEAEAKHAEVTHPHKTDYEPLASMHVAETMWLELDRVVAEIMSLTSGVLTASPEHKLKLQGRCGGLAFAIRNATQPHFYPDEQSVSREAARRYKQSKGEVAWAPTPGYLYNPLRPRPEAVTSAPRAAKAAQPERLRANGADRAIVSPLPREDLAAKAASVSEETKTGIRAAVSSGMFTPAQLTGLYEVSEDVIKYIVQSS